VLLWDEDAGKAHCTNAAHNVGIFAPSVLPRSASGWELPGPSCNGFQPDIGLSCTWTQPRLPLISSPVKKDAAQESHPSGTTMSPL